MAGEAALLLPLPNRAAKPRVGAAAEAAEVAREAPQRAQAEAAAEVALGGSCAAAGSARKALAWWEKGGMAGRVRGAPLSGALCKAFLGKAEKLFEGREGSWLAALGAGSAAAAAAAAAVGAAAGAAASGKASMTLSLLPLLLLLLLLLFSSVVPLPSEDSGLAEGKQATLPSVAMARCSHPAGTAQAGKGTPAQACMPRASRAEEENRCSVG